jgi:hypothetical protein
MLIYPDLNSFDTNKFVLRDRLEDQIQKLKTELDIFSPSIRINFPESSYYSAWRALPLTVGYHVVPPKLIQNLDCIQASYGQDAVSLYHRLALGHFIKESLKILESPASQEPGMESSGLSKDLLFYHFRHFEWILNNLLEQSIYTNCYFTFSNDLFLKDLGVCSLRMIPYGAHVIERLGMSRRFIINNGWKNFFKAGYFYLEKLRHNTPLYHIHLDERWLSDFNRAGWLAVFKMIAEMLKRHSDVRGVFASSWFYDPHLEKISPGLLYLRKVPELGGAKIFKMSSSHQDIENALRNSERRKRLYEEGVYLPTSYMFIWSRTDLMQWADKQTNIYTLVAQMRYRRGT